MSKIIEALEKAKREGTLAAAVSPISERDTLTSTQTEVAISRARSVKPRSHTGLLVTTQVPPELLEGVEEHIDVLRNPMSLVSEQYRALRSRIERLNFEGRIHTIAVTSAVKGEGKSLTAVNLALVMAQDGTKNILLVDADLRRPKVHDLLGLEKEPGLGEYLQGQASREDTLRKTPFFGLTVVTAGRVSGHPSELLASPEFETYVAACRKEYDYLIFDTPPVHPVSDVNFLTETLDGILVVVRAGRTGKNQVKHALESLPEKKILGLVLNHAESLGPGYGRDYRYAKNYYKDYSSQ